MRMHPAILILLIIAVALASAALAALVIRARERVRHGNDTARQSEVLDDLARETARRTFAPTPSTQSTQPPPFVGSAPTSAVAETGEFTRMFGQASVDASKTQAIPSPPRNTVGPVVPLPSREALPRPPSPPPPTPPASAASDFTQLFQQVPVALPPVAPPPASGPSDFTQLFQEELGSAPVRKPIKVTIKPGPKTANPPSKSIPEPTPPPPPLAAVFGAAAPRQARADSEFTASFVVAPPGQEQIVRDAISDANPGSRVALSVQPIDVARGTLLNIRLRARHVRCAVPERSLEWHGRPAILDFEIEVPGDAPVVSLTLRFDVGVAGVVIDTRSIVVQLVPGQPATSVMADVTTPVPRTAFASYAKADRARVLDRVAALRSAAGIDVFTDCLSLLPGEDWKPRLEREISTRDRFLLFWSSHAAASEWVRWEYRAALRLRGMDVIQPQPLEALERSPVPPELAQLHFDDMITRIADSYR
jgi:hypothetical protein